MNIWKGGANDYTLEDLVQDDIILAEKHFNVKLPKSYIDLLKIKNGGTLQYNALPFKQNHEEDDNYIIIEYLFGIKQGEGIFQTKYFVEEWKIERENIIILSGDGHEWLALDYNESSSNPSVIYIFSEENEFIRLFDSFDEMLDNLYIYEEEEEEVDGAIVFTLEEARELIKSSDTTDVLNGISAYEKLYGEDGKVLNEQLQNLLVLIKSENEIISNGAGRSAWYLITYELTNDKQFINKIVRIYEESTNPVFKLFREQILEYIEDNK